MDCRVDIKIVVSSAIRKLKGDAKTSTVKHRI